MASSQIPGKMLKNPYVHRGPIKEPGHFYGRVEETQDLLLHTAEGQSVSSVGPRRIGKTSLLLYLCRSAQAVEPGTGPRHLFVFLDCQRKPGAGKADIYQWMWGEISKGAWWDKARSASVQSGEEFEKAVGELCDAGFELTLLIDEFELMAENSQLSTDFFTLLRGLAVAYPVSYVTSSIKPLLALKYSDRYVLSSPFFNIFQPQHLGLLKPGEAREFIIKPVQVMEDFPAYTDAEICFLFEVAGYHPALLQVACYFLFEHRVKGGEWDAQAEQEVRQKYRDAVVDHFRYAWQQLTPGQRKAMVLICTGQVDEVGRQLWTQLERQCLIYERKPFSSVLREFVLQEGMPGGALEARTSPPVSVRVPPQGRMPEEERPFQKTLKGGRVNLSFMQPNFHTESDTLNWNRTLANLRDVLAGLYLTVQDSRRVVSDAGLNPAYIAFDAKAINNWFNILREAQNRNKVQAIIKVAYGDYPENEWLALAQQGDLAAVKGPDITEDVAWKGLEDADQLEKIIGTQSTLLPIRFLEAGLLNARSVARVIRADGASGSGFLTDDNLLITCHHVLPTEDSAREAVVQFNYQKTVDGLDAPVDEFKLAPYGAFATSPAEEGDWTAVRVEGEPGKRWDTLRLTHVDPQVGDHVNIVQHPGGGPKQIALYHNVVVFVGNNRLQYLTDTLPGSSGSPVFDGDWRVVALHHSGGWLREPGSKRMYFRNEGIHVNAILEGLIAEGLRSA